MHMIEYICVGIGFISTGVGVLDVYKQDTTAIEELPATSYVILFGLLLIGAGFGLDRLGFYVESGIVAALAVVILMLAIIAHVSIWILGRFG